MFRLLAIFIVLATSLASAAEKNSLLGKVQPEIRLTDGTVFKKAKIVDYSIEKSTATIAEPTRIRTVAIDTLPPSLREQLLTEAGVKPPVSPKKLPQSRPRPTRTPTQTGRLPSTPSDTPIATTNQPSQPVDQLLKQAAVAAPLQLKTHLTRTYGQVGSFSTKISGTSAVTGWPRIRVSGETSFTERGAGQRASSIRNEKFEIEYDIAAGVLKPETVTLGGISHPIAP